MTDSKPLRAIPMDAAPVAEPPQPENIVTALLKAPQQVAATIADRRALARSGLVLLVVALLCHALFGLAIGLFGGWQVAAMDAVKAPLIALASLALCFPSLYVFACVAGAPLSLSQAFMVGSASLAMVGLILVGLAPVGWLFAVSTANLAFVVVLTLALWIIAVLAAMRFIGKLRSAGVLQRQGGIKLWFLILILVTLQMVTYMRPILSAPQQGWRDGGKMFFLSHFGDALDD